MTMIKDGERLDSTGFGSIKVIQRKGLGYGVDAILLAAFASGETGAKAFAKNARVADLGTGSGIVAFVSAHKRPDITVDGFELREDAYDRAKRACELNGFGEKIHFFNCDIHDIAGADFACSYDAIVTNPPYFRKASAIHNTSSEKLTARHETTAELGDFIEKSRQLLRHGGDLYMVHRPDRLADIICEMRSHGIEPKELQMVVPRQGESANILLIHGIKGAGSELRILPELSVHTADSEYSYEIERIYERTR